MKPKDGSGGCKQLIPSGCGVTETAIPRRTTRRAASRRPKPERVSISSQAVDAAGLYRDVAAAAEKVATAKYGPAGVCLGVQMVLPGWESLVEGFEAHIGHRGDANISKVVIISVNSDRDKGKSRRNKSERLAA